MRRQKMQTPSGPWAKAWRAVAILVALSAQMLAWSMLLAHNLTRIEKVIASVPSQAQRNLLVLSADVLEYRDYYRHFPETFSEISDQNSLVEYYKRPLYGPVSAIFTILAGQLFGVRFPGNLYLILSLYAASATTFLFVLLRTIGIPTLEGATLAAACTLSFGWFSVFSVPESYSLTVCGALLAMMSGARLPELDAVGARLAIVRHALVVGVASWLYLPICGAAFLVIPRVMYRRHWLTAVAPTVLLAAAAAMLPQFLGGPDALRVELDYGARWSSPRHFVDREIVAQVGSAFMFFGLVSPVADFVYAKPEVDLTAAIKAGTPLAGAGVVLACYGALAFFAVSRGHVKRLSGALLWFLCMFVFHVFFNPREVLLYLSVPVAVLFYLAGLALAPWYEEQRSTFTTGRMIVVCFLILFVAVMLAANVRAIVGS
jgi:hypothetical protein